MGNRGEVYSLLSPPTLLEERPPPAQRTRPGQGPVLEDTPVHDPSVPEISAAREKKVVLFTVVVILDVGSPSSNEKEVQRQSSAPEKRHRVRSVSVGSFTTRRGPFALEILFCLRGHRSDRDGQPS